MKNNIFNLLKKKVLVLDGATGTQLHKRGMPVGVCPEVWCLENVEVISSVHSDYFDAGADIIYTCTFGANRIKLSQYGVKDVVSLNRELAIVARRSLRRKGLVAGDIGPTGKFVKPFGGLDFEEAVDIFKEQVRGLLLGGVDLFVIETMMDIQEARAALIAVKELTDKFTAVTMTFEKDGRTLNGNDPESALITLQSLGANAVGCNCSTGPEDMLKIIKLIKPYATVPLIAKPNAGMPKLINNKTTFSMSAAKFASFGVRLVRAGANVLGGCCGTTPEHIQYLKKAVSGKKPIPPLRKSISALSSARMALIITKRKTFSVIGEKINPTGKKQLQKELLEGNLSLLRLLAKEQENAQAKALDVNVGVPGINEGKVMSEAICALAVSTHLPLVIDSTNIGAIDKALRLYPGRALINSISAEKGKLKKLLPLAKKYGAMCILLPIAGREIPLTFARRKKIIKEIIKEIKKVGLTNDDIIVDALAMTISSSPNAALVAFKTIKWCSEVLKYNTIIGLSNISFGFPRRHLINKVFLTMAKTKGLTLAIADPLDARKVKNKLAENVLLNKDEAGLEFIAKYSGVSSFKKVQKKPKTLPPAQEVFEAIVKGDREIIVKVVSKVLKTNITAIKLMQKYMIPAIIKVGELFEKKEYFLPQLIASAETMNSGFKVIEPHLKKEEFRQIKKAVILLATVRGDIHDIGKNIIALMLKNHGFQIIDIGKDVSAQKIIQDIKRYRPDIVGLSALMTTTMVSMKEVVELARKEGLKCKFMVGGAVVNKTYADSIGATYAKDGVEAVHVAKDLTKL
ncbi:MAG: homocysteine S-methyltransferase family protein [Candidatus Omnitrophota bacterium]|nr:homocysteine S-methyltransferase family protein [Candidatus Omnitrophota bacterium]